MGYNYTNGYMPPYGGSGRAGKPSSPSGGPNPAAYLPDKTPNLTQFGQPTSPGAAPNTGTGGKGKTLLDQAQWLLPNTRPAAPAQPQNPYGSQSGPGILEDWFNKRATGTDPAFEYGLKRGTEQLGNRFSAAGAFNSGAARQQESDLYANLISQREGQLDALAGGASGEHQNRLNSMFSQGLGLAGGESGINSAYDLAAAGAQKDALAAALGYGVNKAGVDSQSTQQGLGNITGILSMIYGGGALANKSK